MYDCLKIWDWCLLIYIGCNLLLTGYQFSAQDEVRSKRDLAAFIIVIFLTLTIGCVGYALIYIWSGLSWLATLFQLGFFWKFWFTKDLSNLTQEELERVNKTSDKHFNTNSLRHRIFRFCTSMINKRYKYKKNEDNTPS